MEATVPRAVTGIGSATNMICNEVDQIRRGKEYVEAINAGKCGIKCGPKITTSNGRETYRPVWVDLE